MSSPCAAAARAVHAARDEERLVDDPVEQRVAGVEQVARGALLGMLENRRVAALEVPGVEEERPVDVGAQLLQGGLDEARTREGRSREVVGVPRDRGAALAGGAERQQRHALALGVKGAQAFLLDAVLGVEGGTTLRLEQRADDADHPGGVEHVAVGGVYSGAIRTAVCWRDVVAPPTSSGSCSPRRSISFATTTISSSDGVIRPDRPTTSQPCSTAVSRIVSAGTITPRIDHLVGVAAEHDADDVLADVVDVAPDGREDDAPALRPPSFSASMNGSR